MQCYNPHQLRCFETHSQPVSHCCACLAAHGEHGLYLHTLACCNACSLHALVPVSRLAFDTLTLPHSGFLSALYLLHSASFQVLIARQLTLTPPLVPPLSDLWAQGWAVAL